MARSKNSKSRKRAAMTLTSRAQQDEILSRLHTGATVDEVAQFAQQEGVKEHLLRGWAKRAGLAIETKPRGFGKTDSFKAAVLAEWQSAADQSASARAALAQKHGVSDQSLRNWLKAQSEAKAKAARSNGKSTLQRQVARPAPNDMRSNGIAHTNGLHPGSLNPPSSPALALEQAEALLQSSLTQVKTARAALDAFWSVFSDGGSYEANGVRGGRASPGEQATRGAARG